MKIDTVPITLLFCGAILALSCSDGPDANPSGSPQKDVTDGGIGGTGGTGGTGNGPSNQPCVPACLEGYQCSDGICMGGDAEMLGFAVDTVVVGGNIHVDGLAPTASCAGDQVRIEFITGSLRKRAWDPILGNRFPAGIPCTATDGSFSTRVAPGTYRVLVSRYDSDSTFPDATFVADPAFAVTQQDTGIQWNFSTVPVAGNIVVDGVPPQGDDSCGGDQVRVSFVNDEGGSFHAGISCDATDGSFSTRVAPGTYRVLVSRYDSGSTFPDATFVADPAFAVTQQDTGIQWNLSTVPVAGNIVVDGVSPKGDDSCGGDQVRVSFVNDDGGSFHAGIPCDATDGSFSTRVAPGTYRVLASRYDSGSTFPDATFVADPAFAVTQQDTGIQWKLSSVPVAGSVVVDGIPPQGDDSCGGDQVRVSFVNDDGGSFHAGIPCDATDGSFSTRVAPGNYRVLASRYDSGSTFPDATFVADPAFAVTQQDTGIQWNLSSVPVAGSVVVDGVPPQGDDSCGGDQVRVAFVDDDGASFHAGIPCTASDGSFSTRVAPGTYRVLARRYDSGSTFPDATILLQAGIDIR
jgi:hypothetical protein